MKKALTLLLATLLGSAATVSAQATFRLGLRGGLNRALTTQAAEASYTSQTPDYDFANSADKSAIYAWQAGVVAEVSFGKLSLQPALVFSQKGEKVHNVLESKSRRSYYYSRDEQDATNRYNWLELPLNVVYTMHGDHGFQIFGGPYVALALGGRQKGTLSGNSSGPIGPYSLPVDEAITYGSGTANQRLDMGLNFGVGYRQGPLQVQLGYGLGLRNLRQHRPEELYDPGFARAFGNFDTYAAYNRTAQLTGTYFFSL